MDFVAGYNSGHGGKPEPGMVLAFAKLIGADPSEVVMVGDSLHDLDAGRGAGALTVAVLSGPASRAELEPHADLVIAHIGELPPLLETSDEAMLLEDKFQSSCQLDFSWPDDTSSF